MSENPTIVFTDVESVSIEERDVPEPGSDQVMIRSERTLVSTGTELTVLSGDVPPGSSWDDTIEYPFTPGYNNVGTVVETGDAVETISTGDRVATYGSHAKYVRTDASTCRPIPDGVTDDDAVFFTIAEIVMNGIRRSGLTWGESSAVYGLGLLGQLAVRIGHAAGARPVVGFDVADSRLEYLPDKPNVVGANPLECDPETVLREESEGRLADVVFEVTGNPNVITDEFDVLRDQGRLVVLSSPRGETRIDLHDHCNTPSYRIIGAHNSSHPSTATPDNPWTQHRHAELFFEYVTDGSIDVSSLVSHSVPFREGPRLYDDLLEDRSEAMGIVLEWE
ncbi:zinc-binding dehydrogenase [Natronosalvus rutilus]|uniref:Zinc-binding dehydrogenase n=1 Tax=Natronosalvus rutilus TaxID=2953753 RepID=A0A9E7N8G5_9EURY|nr:zinc-binding dehydrogenase [Natronosalvus rutilus]UTF52444.1 zinc-binding dehydrogenase [Natronosalvus rutilus]